MTIELLGLLGFVISCIMRMSVLSVVVPCIISISRRLGVVVGWGIIGWLMIRRRGRRRVRSSDVRGARGDAGRSAVYDNAVSVLGGEAVALDEHRSLHDLSVGVVVVAG